MSDFISVRLSCGEVIVSNKCNIYLREKEGSYYVRFPHLDDIFHGFVDISKEVYKSILYPMSNGGG